MDPVLHSFAYALDFLREQVADVDTAKMVAQPRGIRNHPAWLIGHLTDTCQQLGGCIGLSPWLPEEWTMCYGTGSQPIAQANLYKPKQEALDILGDAKLRITEAVRRLNSVQLNQPFPDAAYRGVFPTICHALTQVLVAHTGYHIGQLALWRKAEGLTPLRRVFE